MNFNFCVNDDLLILGACDFLSDEYNQSCIMALPSFIIAVNGGRDFQAQKVHSSIINSAPRGSGG